MSFEPSKELRGRFEKILDLAPLPGSSPRSLERLREALTLLGDDIELHVLIEPVSQDPALTARVVGLANSAFFARAVPVETVELAAARIGARRVRQLVFMQRVSEALLDTSYSPVLRQIWQRSIAVAYCSESIASETDGVDSDRAFAAGLLHDLGTMIIADQAPELMAAMLESAGDVSLQQLFGRSLGGTPTDVARAAVHQHDFPSPLAETMVGYANPRPADPPIVRVVHVARALCGGDARYPALTADRTELAYDVCSELGLGEVSLARKGEEARHWIDVSRNLA